MDGWMLDSSLTSKTLMDFQCTYILHKQLRDAFNLENVFIVVQYGDKVHAQLAAVTCCDRVHLKVCV